MDMRARVNEALKKAMKEQVPERLSTLRLINAAIKDKDIAARGNGRDDGVDDGEVLLILSKMTKQRQESARVYEEGGRLDLAERERQEIEVISEFLPRQMDDDEVDSAIRTIVKSTGASSIRDMGKVMAELKGRYNGRMDFSKIGPMVKDALCSQQKLQ